LSATGFAGRRAVVTGAGHGIGEAIARRLFDAGARVMAIDRDEARLVSAFGSGQCRWLVASVGTSDPVALAEAVLADGPVELIVNNVAGWTGRTFLYEDPALFAESLTVSLQAPALLH
jgi:NAD(P)-dependent dehydrogenase (short-subunit alcohol dehydrogenase family)